MAANPLRALVVDDSALYRKVVRTVLEEIPGVTVVATATNGRVAIEIAQREAPDFVTLDLEMPELDGLGFLRQAKGLQKIPGVIMLSARTDRSAKVTTEALSLGAFDFILKPQASDLASSLAQIRQQLAPRIHALRDSLAQQNLRKLELPSTSSPPALVAAQPTKPRKPEFLAIGVSTGGPAALTDLLPRLPGDFPVPILIVQHMPPVFTRTLAEELDHKCRLTVREAQGGESPKAGEVYIAPGGRHMKLESTGLQRALRVTDDPKERSCRPSVDYLFRSLSFICGRNTVGLVMTGMGDDGLLGCKLLKRQGAMILAQARESCVVYGMPKCVVDEGLADEVIALPDLAGRLTEVVQPAEALTWR
jgi:two-component system, chemotaxis family, protein-glutamate methylesterase/glutaminase